MSTLFSVTTSLFTPSFTLVYPSTLNRIPFPISSSPNFSVSFSQDYKIRNRRVISVIIDKSEPEPEPEPEEEYDGGVKAALSVLNFYKREISPLLPKSCRYVPTCSEYSMIAYKRYGFAKGSVLTACRICRCNPLGGSGFDPPRWFGEERPPEE